MVAMVVVVTVVVVVMAAMAAMAVVVNVVNVVMAVESGASGAGAAARRSRDRRTERWRRRRRSISTRGIRWRRAAGAAGEGGGIQHVCGPQGSCRRAGGAAAAASGPVDCLHRLRQSQPPAAALQQSKPLRTPTQQPNPKEAAPTSARATAGRMLGAPQVPPLRCHLRSRPFLCFPSSWGIRQSAARMQRWLCWAHARLALFLRPVRPCFGPRLVRAVFLLFASAFGSGDGRTGSGHPCCRPPANPRATRRASGWLPSPFAGRTRERDPGWPTACCSWTDSGEQRFASFFFSLLFLLRCCRRELSGGRLDRAESVCPARRDGEARGRIGRGRPRGESRSERAALCTLRVRLVPRAAVPVVHRSLSLSLGACTRERAVPSCRQVSTQRCSPRACSR